MIKPRASPYASQQHQGLAISNGTLSEERTNVIEQRFFPDRTLAKKLFRDDPINVLRRAAAPRNTPSHFLCEVRLPTGPFINPVQHGSRLC